MSQDDMAQPGMTPIYASMNDMRQRLLHCKDCAQRREILDRWLLGVKIKAGMIKHVPPEQLPRDMSVLMKEK